MKQWPEFLKGELKKHYRFMTKVIRKLHLTHDPGLDFESQKINAMKTITGATGKSETWFADWITVLFHFLLLIRGLCLFVCFLNEWASLVAQTGKKSACNAGDPGLTPWLGRSPGEGNS